MVSVENKNPFYSLVFQNEHFLIVDKAPMVLSVPARSGDEDSRFVLGRILEQDFSQILFPVHRLDFEVQGLIMYARNEKAHRAGNQWFEKKIVSKKYSALTSIPLNHDSFRVGETLEWKCRLLRGKKRAYESIHGKDSLTISKLVSNDYMGYFHWELSPITGRSHQLRYELFRHGMPIVGDSLYGSSEKFKNPGIALRSFEIDFSRALNFRDFLLPEKIISPSF